MSKHSGLIPFIHKISDAEIRKFLKEWRKQNPQEKRTDEELRPCAVNSILTKLYDESQTNDKNRSNRKV